jgi:hypothetical protein
MFYQSDSIQKVDVVTDQNIQSSTVSIHLSKMSSITKS